MRIARAIVRRFRRATGVYVRPWALDPFDDASASRPIQRLLVTGAAGRVANLVLPALRERYPVIRLTDRRTVSTAGPRDEIVRADLSRVESLARAVRDCDAILHLGAASGKALWRDIERANIRGAENVFELAVALRVPRVVFASTMHVLGMYRRDEPLDARIAPTRPDSFYAVSKVFGEACGRMYAARYGLRVASVRIGHVTERRDTGEPGAWIGSADLAALFIALLDDPTLHDETVPAVAPCDGDDLGQLDTAARFGFTFREQGPSYAAALAEVPRYFPGDLIAQTYRGGWFASNDWNDDDASG